MPTLTAHHDGVDLAYQRFGCSGDPLLLIMGIGADMLYWHDEFCNTLVAQGFQVARFDSRDSGESTHLDWAGTLIVAGCAAIPTPRPTGSRTWPTTRPRPSTPAAGPVRISSVTRWAE